jgi:hypothetical protein
MTACCVPTGDEICCGNTSCWKDQLDPISSKLRSLLGHSAILYENDCGEPGLFEKLDRIPPDLDWFSVDGYWGYDLLHGAPDGATEAKMMRDFAERTIYPKMSPSQQLAVVPGTFACSNFSYMPLENSSRSVIAKLRAYFEWAKVDSKVIAMFPWHVNWLLAGGDLPCDMRLGATDIPGVVPELNSIATWIRSKSALVTSPYNRLDGTRT